MARIKGALNRTTRRKKLADRVSGFHLGRKNLRQAIEASMKADAQMFIGRKLRKRQFRRLWTQRINAAARQNGLTYSRLINGLKRADIEINRKMLADLAVHDSAAFTALVEKAKAALEK